MVALWDCAWSYCFWIRADAAQPLGSRRGHRSSHRRFIGPEREMVCHSLNLYSTLPNLPSTPLGGGCFVRRNLIGGAISVVNDPYRPQHPDMCLQHHPCLTLPPSQDANSSSEGESQKNGHHVRVHEFMYFGSYFTS